MKNIRLKINQYTKAALCFHLAFTVATAFTASIAIAETHYIKDEIYVPLRSGPSSKNRILHKGLKSGTAVNVIPNSEKEGWVNVRVTPELEGWLPEQYLLATPTSDIKLKIAEDKLTKLNVRFKEISDTHKKQSNQLKKTKDTLTKTETEQQKTMLELRRIRSISSGAIELDEKYQRLLEQYELSQTTNDTLNAENANLKADRRFSYMFYGAALIILGMLMSVILPRLKIKKRNSEWAN